MTGGRVEHDDGDVSEARYELVISVDARRSGAYDDVDKAGMRGRIYRVLEGAFTQAKVAADALHLEDRGDGVLVAVAGRVAVTRLLGLWLVEVHENLKTENRELKVPLGLRVAMHVGPVRHDSRGISGRAVDLACRLADCSVARDLLDRPGADLVLVTSDRLYDDVVRSGGKYIEPDRYAQARVRTKEGEVSAWFHLPRRDAPPDIPAPRPASGAPAQEPAQDPAQEPDRASATEPDSVQRPAAPQDREERRQGGGDTRVGGDAWIVQGGSQNHSHLGHVIGDADRRKD